MGKEEKGVKRGVFSRLFRKQKIKELEPAMEEEIEDEFKGAEPQILKTIDLDKKGADAPYELRFWVCDGTVIKSLKELANALSTMSKETFKYHANNEKNEFSTWVAEVIGNRELAEKMRKARAQKDMLKVVKESVSMPKTKTKPKPEMSKKTKRAKLNYKAEAKKRTVKQSTFKQLIPKVRVKKEKSKGKRSLNAWEQELLMKEQALNDEERRLNEKKLILSKRRVALLKEKGELEKQKFEKFLLGKGRSVSAPETIPLEENIPEIEAEEQKGVNDLREAVAQAHTAVEQGRVEEANRLISRARNLLRTVYLKEDEKRRIEYEVLELEADAKLASLS